MAPDDEFHVASASLLAYGQAVLAAGNQVTDAAKAHVAEMVLPAAAFGNSDGAGSTHAAYTTASAAGRSVLDAASEALETDADKLTLAAFGYEDGDHRAGGAYRRINPGQR